MIPFAMNQVHQGDVLELLGAMPDESVQCVVTSPPYWGLRDYGLPPTVWGGEQECEHEWGDELPRAKDTKTNDGFNERWHGETQSGQRKQEGGGRRGSGTSGAFCQDCGAWRGCLGLEPTPELYVEHLIVIFREVRRVLRADGTCWLNMGDCYATGAGKVGDCPGGGDQGERWRGRAVRDGRHAGKHTAMVAMGPMTQPNRMPIPGLKPKDRVMMPARVALALQADGWWLRSEIVWSKLNPMPSSVRDRPTDAHEMIYLLTKAARYFYDENAIREAGAEPERQRTDRIGGRNGHQVRHSPGGMMGQSTTRNCRTVWTITVKGYEGAHFATFPEALVEPCILAGTSEKGACPDCGAPWKRQVTSDWREHRGDSWREQEARGRAMQATDSHRAAMRGGLATVRAPSSRETVGWEPTCACECNTFKPIPCVVLDPFAGSGTTGVVALKHGRQFIGFDLSEEYVAMANERIAAVKTGVSVKDRRGGQRSLFEVEG